MKLTCPFCKTEYAANIAAGRRVECAACGHVWAVPRKKGNGFLMWLAAICLALSAAVFVAVSMAKYRHMRGDGVAPLAIENGPMRAIVGEDGRTALVVVGKIKNNSGKIHGIPDMVVSIKNESGDVIAVRKFMPPAPLLDAGESVEFRHAIDESLPNAKKFAVEFSEDN